MTVGEMKELLEDYDDSVEIRSASQPQWAFEYEIIQGHSAVDLWHEQRHEEGIEDDGEVDPEEPTEVLYLFEGRQLGYLPGYLKAGWGR